MLLAACHASGKMLLASRTGHRHTDEPGALTRDAQLGRVLFIERFVRLHEQRQAVGTAEPFDFLIHSGREGGNTPGKKEKGRAVEVESHRHQLNYLCICIICVIYLAWMRRSKQGT